MKTLLVPTDGSLHAKKAIDLACDLAKLHGARIEFLHILLRDKQAPDLRKLLHEVELSEPLRRELDQASAMQMDAAAPDWMPVMSPETLPSTISDHLLESLGSQVLKAAETTALEKGVDCCSTRLESGDPVGCILKAAEETGADTIVMGHRGLRDIEAAAFGSVSNKVSHESTCSVVMVK